MIAAFYIGFLAGIIFHVWGMERMKTMTLNLSDKEMEVLEHLAKSEEMTKTAIMRQALRHYQLLKTPPSKPTPHARLVIPPPL